PASAIWYPFDEGEDCLTLVGILNNQLIVRRIAEEVRDKYDQCCLSLKPLSQITDEDAIEVAKIRYPVATNSDLHKPQAGRDYINHHNENGGNFIARVADF